MKIYYAHFMGLYGTKQEKRDLALLYRLFPNDEIVNPSDSVISNRYLNALGNTHKDDPRRMQWWQDLASSCDLVVFRALPNGQLTAGVGAEVAAALANDKMILELPALAQRETLTKRATRELMKEWGVY